MSLVPALPANRSAIHSITAAGAPLSNGKMVGFHFEHLDHAAVLAEVSGKILRDGRSDRGGRHSLAPTVAARSAIDARACYER